VPPGHTLSFKQALTLVSGGVFQKVLLPEWAMGWRKGWRDVRDGFRELEGYMEEMIEERRRGASGASTGEKGDGEKGEEAEEEKEQRYDLFSSLLDATDGETEAPLTAAELMSNVFIFLLAGHEVRFPLTSFLW
jgi:cytochrome P450